MAALKTPDQLDTARSLLAEHGPPLPPEGGQVPEWRLLVAPLAGTFRAGSPEASAIAPGCYVTTGATLGLIESRGDYRAITPPCPGALIEWLVEDGDLVSAGQPIARLEPAASEQRAK